MQHVHDTVVCVCAAGHLDQLHRIAMQGVGIAMFHLLFAMFHLLSPIGASGLHELCFASEAFRSW